MSVKPSRPFLLSRRSLIAGASGLALAGGLGNSAVAQIAEGDLPDAAAALTQVMPTAAPKLRFTDTTGRQLTLQNYHGHTLVVNLWATWCGPCIAEIPSFAALAQHLKDSGVLILPISIDLTGAAVVRPFFARHGIRNLPILLNQDGSDMQVLDSNGIPVSVVIDPHGR
ncbi:TlpA disulfide reductase family protein, partial [Acidocella sp.]|uniref:TlpA disulfide reductase family protein n=1 Tax=Acidocella sp. TaxID=50710 RepID=UPI002F4167DD